MDSPVRYNSVRRLKNAVAFLYYLPNLVIVILLGGYYSLIKNGLVNNAFGLNFVSTFGISLFLGSLIGALLFFNGFAAEIGHDKAKNRAWLSFLPIIILMILFLGVLS
ncbi:MAG: hypothetical protein IH840_17770 [Candidatus Heimdallarchaeota archaeon]|nr:hypothetical protein [Candidatus Heimdallarchaeota archaeon]